LVTRFGDDGSLLMMSDARSEGGGGLEVLAIERACMARTARGRTDARSEVKAILEAICWYNRACRNEAWEVRVV
jgi:hypothetical protein